MTRKKREALPMPELPAASYLSPEDREAISVWIKAYQERQLAEFEGIEGRLRAGKEHPCEAYALQVRNLGGLGMEERLVARVLGITMKVLREHYLSDYEMGEAIALIPVAANIMRAAQSNPDAAMALKVMERRGGVKFSQKALAAPPEEVAPPIIDYSNLTYEQRQQFRGILQSIADGQVGEPLRPEEVPAQLIELDDSGEIKGPEHAG